MRRSPAFAVPLLLLGASSSLAQSTPVDFTRDVRPILTGKCFQCHGPDDKVRKAGLRLDTRDGAIKKLDDGWAAIVPGDATRSELLWRVFSDNPAQVMPPAKVGKPISPEEFGILKRWIEQGAPYPAHWAYLKPVRPPLPEVRSPKSAIRNEIDRFILARLEKEGLQPQPPADKHALLRRLSIDLTGLPPTIAEADEFLKDTSTDAYEKLVDRLLAKKSFGERWAAGWLDLARYADSQGFANDPDRTIWRYRDWVIDALNDNLPFDRFTIEQLAGDLLPNATTSQQIATGFHRNTLTNTEGGTNPEEFRSAAIVDRVNTTFQVWMGTTIACAQCHNHKYDPFSQKEFFQAYAVFNNCEDANAGNDAPTITVVASGQEAAYEEATKKLADVRKPYDELTKSLDANQAAWEKSVDAKKLPKELADILQTAASARKAPQKTKLADYYRGLDPKWKGLDAEVKALDAKIKAISVQTPVLKEGKPRETFIQIRGNFLDKGEKVTAGLPASLPGPTGGTVDRLALARWLVSPDNPLTARVAVSRLWEELFGVGIVETSEDFGTQGELPSHPDLLDWLATEYVRIGWDTKQMIKLMVTSATYRQSSQMSNPQSEIRNPKLEDPFNRLLSRGPRVRLSAETVRDQALFVSGLLSAKMHGPPVQPPRPNFGLNAAFGSSTDWQASSGEDKNRRALYTRWRRNAPYPSMTTFDAPERTTCNVRRLRTNTPLQALVTLNDPVYVEAAQALARRIVKEGGDSLAAQVIFAFRLVLTRPPTDVESKRLVELVEHAREKYGQNPTQATALASKPLGPIPEGMNAVNLAAWTVLGNVLLNLDETLAKR